MKIQITLIIDNAEEDALVVIPEHIKQIITLDEEEVIISCKAIEIK